MPTPIDAANRRVITKTAISSSLSSAAFSTSISQISVIKDAASPATIRLRKEFGNRAEPALAKVRTVDEFLDYVAAERLTTMPHRNSQWDRILHWAAYFASQTSLFADALGSTVVPTGTQSLVFSALYILIQAGVDQAHILIAPFGVLHHVAFQLLLLLRHRNVFVASEDTQRALALLYADVLRLVVDLTSSYAHGGSSTDYAVQVDLIERFASRVESIADVKERAFSALWRFQLAESTDSSPPADISEIRDFLRSSDQIVRSIATIHDATGGLSREEHTCEWFADHLRNLTSSPSQTISLVTGKSGSGKTVLSRWTSERLLRADGNSQHDVLFAQVDVESRTTSPVKELLLQLLERRVGDYELYQALSTVLSSARRGKGIAVVEQELWQALEIGLKHLGPTVLIIDGLNEVHVGEEESIRVIERLNVITGNKPLVKSIVFSRPLSRTVPVQMHTVHIDSSLVQDDIRRVVLSSIARSEKLRKLGHGEQAQVARRISTQAGPSFVWAQYALEILSRQSSVSAMLSAIEKLPKDLDELITQVVGFIDLKAHDTRSLLAWMLVTERPLRLDEIKTFWEIDLASSSHKPRFTEVADDVVKALGPLITTSGGVCRFRHISIKDHLVRLAESVKDLSNSGPFPFQLQEAHYDLAVRCVAYYKILFPRQAEPSFDVIASDDIKSISQSNVCAEYAARFWTHHFRLSPMFESSGNHKLVSEFRSNFPESSLLAKLEGSVRAGSFVSSMDITIFDLALSVRQSLLKADSPALLQTLIFLARAYQADGQVEKAATTYLKAYDISAVVLGEDNEVTFSLTAGYLSATADVKITSRNDTCIKREKMLQHMLSYYRKEYGATNDTVFKYTQLLGTLLTDTQQWDAASTCWEDVYNLSIQRFGYWSDEVSEIQQTLLTTLAKSSHKERISKIERAQYESCKRSLAITDERRTASTNRLLEHYKSTQNSTAYEEILVDSWQAVSRAASTSSNSRLQKKKLDLSLSYIGWLKSQDRTAEAASILAGLHKESESKSISSETSASYLALGKELRSLGMIATAKSMFSKLTSYYSASGHSSSKEAVFASSELSQTVHEEIQMRAKSIIASSQASSNSDEETSLALFDSVSEWTSSEHTAEQRETSIGYIISSCQTISESFYQKGRFQACARTCSQALVTAWSSVLTRQASITLPSAHRAELLQIAYRLADCYMLERQVDKAESIFRNIYQASVTALSISDDLVLASFQRLVAFYEKVYAFDKALRVYGEFYALVKKQAGLTNALTTRIAFAAIEFALKMNDFHAAEAYMLDIFTRFTDDKLIISREGGRVAVDLAKYYRDERRWESAERIYNALWQTFSHSGLEAGFTVDQVEDIYTTYIHIKRDIKKVHYEELRQIVIQYQQTCIKFLGSDHELTIQATIHLANISQQKEQYHQESISLYESAIKSSRALAATSTTATATASAITTATLMRSISTARSALASMYTSSSSTSKEAATRSAELYDEAYQSSISEHGYSHESSLSELRKFAQTASKSQSQETRTKAVSLLNKTMTEVLVKEKRSGHLVVAAQSLASSYLALNQKEAALEIYHNARRQLVTSVYDSKSKLEVNIKGADRRSFSFLVAFWQTLTASKESFSALISDLTAETVLYQQYQAAVSQKQSFDSTFELGARLALFYRQRRRGEEYQRVLSELLRGFAAQLNASESSATLREFFDLCFARMESDESDTTAVVAVADLVYAKLTQGSFQEAYDLVYYADRFVQLDGGWRTEQNIDAGLQLCLHLTAHSGTPKCPDNKLFQLMLKLAASIIREILHAAGELQINFLELPVRRLVAVLTLLSDVKDYTNLEWILSRLWYARNAQSVWDSTAVVYVGRRLVEVRFALGRHDQAIHLCEDITYNLRRVWGTFDKTTLDMFELLGGLYAANGDFRKALAVHEEILRQAVIASELDGDLATDIGAQVVSRHLVLLKRSYQRNGGWNKQSSSYDELFASLTRVFGSEKSFTTALSSQGTYNKWAAKGKGQAEDSQGLWAEPATFEFSFLADGGAVQAQKQHYNHIRKTSGLVNALHGGPQMKPSPLPTNAESQKMRVNGHASGHLNGNGQAQVTA